MVRGRGKLVGEKSDEVVNENGQRCILSVNHDVVVATGSEPVLPVIAGLKAY